MYGCFIHLALIIVDLGIVLVNVNVSLIQLNVGDAFDVLMIAIVSVLWVFPQFFFLLDTFSDFFDKLIGWRISFNRDKSFGALSGHAYPTFRFFFGLLHLRKISIYVCFECVLRNLALQLLINLRILWLLRLVQEWWFLNLRLRGVGESLSAFWNVVIGFRRVLLSQVDDFWWNFKWYVLFRPYIIGKRQKVSCNWLLRRFLITSYIFLFFLKILIWIKNVLLNLLVIS